MKYCEYTPDLHGFHPLRNLHFWVFPVHIRNTFVSSACQSFEEFLYMMLLKAPISLKCIFMVNKDQFNVTPNNCDFNFVSSNQSLLKNLVLNMCFPFALMRVNPSSDVHTEHCSICKRWSLAHLLIGFESA